MLTQSRIRVPPQSTLQALTEDEESAMSVVLGKSLKFLKKISKHTARYVKAHNIFEIIFINISLSAETPSCLHTDTQTEQFFYSRQQNHHHFAFVLYKASAPGRPLQSKAYGKINVSPELKTLPFTFFKIKAERWNSGEGSSRTL